jgi:LacI family transcriptional regulator
MATIKDVAARAGVSYTTVSHVVNKTKRVSDHVRSEVESAIHELGYVPNTVARSLKRRTTLTIGLLISNSTNPFFAELARGIEDACYQRGYSVILCNSEDDPEREQDLPASLVGKTCRRTHHRLDWREQHVRKAATTAPPAFGDHRQTDRWR